MHKHLVTKLLEGGAAYDRFMQKISKFDAAQDYEEEGGVGIDMPLDQDDDDEARDVEFAAIKPETAPEEPVPYTGPYPPLPSQSQARSVSGASDLSATMRKMSLGGNSESATAVGSRDGTSRTPTSSRQLNPWGGKAAKQLFPEAKPTPPPSEFSISYHDEQMEHEHGINIMNTRFWDPLSRDWNPERFYDTVVCKYYCPFICE